MSNHFNADELKELKEQFGQFDTDKSGDITIQELEQVIKNLGEKVTQDRLKKMIEEIDVDKNGTVNFEEFCEMVFGIRTGKTSGFGEVYTKHVKLNIVEGATLDTQHSFSDEEKFSFAEHINAVLAEDKWLKENILPINPDNMKLFSDCRDGVMLCKLINWAVPGTIDERAVNMKKNMNIYKITENQNIVLNSAKAIGCNVINVGAGDLIDGRPHLVLSLIWQIVKIGILASINLKNNPYLVRLLEPGEDLEHFMKLSPEEILLRWVNYHLKNAGYEKKVTNFTGDIADSKAYTYLIHEIAPPAAGTNRDPLKETDPLKRADAMLQQADKIKCRKFVRPSDVVNKNGKLNLAFVANLFNTCPALAPVETPVLPVVEDVEEAREERAFRMWINSLGVDPEVKSLFDDLKDGVILLQLLDKIQPGIVDWSKVNKKPSNQFKRLENCNYAVSLGKKMGFSLVGIAGEDVCNGNKKLTLALIWQAMRMYILNFIKSLSKGDKKVDDDYIVNWCNEKVKAAGKSSTMANFKDPTLTNSKFLIDLLSACDKECVDYSIVEPGKDDKEKERNAKYCITIARKIGCSVFLLWEDIVEVKAKMIMTFCGSVLAKFGEN